MEYCRGMYVDFEQFTRFWGVDQTNDCDREAAIDFKNTQSYQRSMDPDCLLVNPQKKNQLMKKKWILILYLSRTAEKKLWLATYYLSSPRRNFPNNISAPLSFAETTSLLYHWSLSTKRKSKHLKGRWRGGIYPSVEPLF